MDIHHDLAVLAKTISVALAVGLDVLAVSVGVGVANLTSSVRLRLGLAFASSEITMQVLGYALGCGVGRVLGEGGAYLGFGLLGFVGILMVRNTFEDEPETGLEPTHGWGLLMTSLSISLDSFGVGVALPAAAIPLLPLLVVISVSTTVFTAIGLAFGARLGAKYERGAGRAAGIILIALAMLFTAELLI